MDMYKANICTHMKTTDMMYQGNFYIEVMYITSVGYTETFLFETREEANKFISACGTSHVEYKVLAQEYLNYLYADDYLCI